MRLRAIQQTIPYAAGLALLALALFQGGCKRTFNESSESSHPSLTEEQGKPSHLPAAALELWRRHLRDQTGGTPLLEGCEPKRFVVPEGVTHRGTALLFHGFLSCPQQLHSLASELARNGYEVLLPLSPGHGRNSSRSTDTAAALPTINQNNDGVAQYAGFVTQMNTIIRFEPAEKVVGGFSLGATMATWATTHEAGLYDRAFLVAPLFGITDHFRRRLGVANLPSGPEPGNNSSLGIQLGLGETCEEERDQDRGTHGYCQFRVGDVAAAVAFAAASLTGASPVSTQFQFLAIEDDPMASMKSTSEAIAKVKALSTRPVEACFFTGGAGSGSLSRVDAQSRFEAWHKALNTKAAAFITNGSPLPLENRSSLAAGHKLCREQ
jgi:pimeloyl-ACP methyl ester carboxylesterase